MNRRRVAVGGLIHQSNSFAPVPADLAAFAAGGITRGAAVLELAGQNLVTGGFVAAAVAAGVEIVPLLIAAAEPAGPVTRAAFETLAGELLRGLAAAGPLDGLFLDLHGAMLVADDGDGEGTLPARVRAVVGEVLPVVCALDFHANVSAAMVALSDGLLGYRTYPHVDMAATGRRAFGFLRRRLAAGRPAARALALGNARCSAKLLPRCLASAFDRAG